MALTAQNVIDDASFEVRKRLDGTSGSGADFTLMLRWVDQVHKDLLHTGIFKHMLRAATTITSAAGSRSYPLTPTDVRRIDAVYDRNSEKFLQPLDLVYPSSNLPDPQDKKGTQPVDRHITPFQTSAPAPLYYRFQTVVTAGVNAHTLWLYPPPRATENAGTMDIFYTKDVVTIAAAATQLQCGEDGRDAMVAGLLARTYSFLRNNTKAAEWQAKYERLKAGETLP